MLPQSPLEYALWGGLILGGWVLGLVTSTFEGKWRRRFNDERRFYSQYRDETDRLNIEKTRRIAELEAQKNALSQEVVRLRSDAAAPASAAAPAAPPPAPPPAPEPAVETVSPDNDVADTTDLPTPVAEPAPIEAVVESAPTLDPGPAPAAPSASPLAMASIPVTAAALTHPNILPHIETEADLAALGLASEAPPVPTPPPADETAPEPEPEPVDLDDQPVPLDEALTGLTRIRGIDDTLAAGLASLGVRQIEDIETLSAEDEKAIEIQLNLPPGQIANQQWRLQAALIGSGEDGLIGG